MEIYTKKVKEGELLVYEEVLGTVADIYNPTFSLLVLPKAMEINTGQSVVILPFYEGETFNEKWNEKTGGILLGLDLSVEIPEILRELSTIAIGTVLDNKKLQNISRFTFNTEEYLPEFDSITNRIVSRGLLEKEESDKAREMIIKKFPSKLMISNGDFYPRNLIRLPDNKLVLIDWETWNTNSPAYIVDHAENIAAFCFVHMWNNPAWQKNYVNELRKRFDMNKEDFQRAILIKSLEMANFWLKDGREENPLCDSQIVIFRNALNENYMAQLWD